MKLINDISLIKLSTFIKCSVHKDYRLLIEEGEPTDEELERNWLYVLSEYHKTRQTQQVGHFVFLTSRMRMLEARLYCIQNCVNALLYIQPFFDDVQEAAQGIIDNLKSFGHKFSFTKESIPTDCQRIETAEKRNILELQKLQREAETNEGSKKGTTEADFLNTLFDINKAEGATYKASEVTVQEYCILVSRLEKHIENLNRKNNAV